MACNQNKDNKIHAKFTLLAVSSDNYGFGEGVGDIFGAKGLGKFEWEALRGELLGRKL